MARRNLFGAVCAVSSLFVVSQANAALVVADFNDLSTGNLAGQGGGSGLTGNWVGSTFPQVIPGDLTAPAGTNYAVAQSAGTAQSLRATGNNDNTNGQDTRSTASTLAGTVWFSFLANPNDANARVGISFNTSGNGASGSRITLTGANLFVSYGNTTISNTQTTGVTHLIVGEVVVNEAGNNDHLRLWIDPDVNTLTESTTTNKKFDQVNADWVASGITSLSVHSYGATSPGGTLDAVRVSDSPAAQSDVTGVPEPTSAALLGIAGLAVVSRRRR